MGYFFRFLAQVLRTAFYIIRQRRIETRRAYALLAEVERKYDGRFSDKTRRKIAVSYGIYNPMMCDAFTALRGRRTTEAEKERFIYYFVCSSLFDDFTDVLALPEDELLALSFAPERFEPRNFDEAVFRDAHLQLRSFVHERTVYDALTRKLFQAQWDSKKQARTGVLSEDALREITFRKGGLSVLLCSFYLEVTPTPAERDCWYRIGTIIQLTNDLFDIYKDLGDQMDTLPLRMRDVAVFRVFFEDQVVGMFHAVESLEVTERRKGPFRLAMAGISAFGMIALDQFAELTPPFTGYTRQELVIDMEKRQNLAAWLRYTYRMAKRPLPSPSSGTP
ncbi:class 1 isoprenoid biosynthesis enzyme [Dinghuibacter silviterrae]|uniref:Uncharacterized protein n=1 Tax=Dinghuibacter silviterrae TaxID=1539049 RepID=A0A4R8DHR2_9BACT|nr:class 1 isoprenoid biosynthesis enzyme [Dinghuibacter silviterrae]TDW97261.1 hypothetical protein EDB95_5108 [Dinghuibacter silviterrae]